MLRSTIIDAIGQTPLVKLRLDENAIGPVYAKLEMMNLFGMKDRVAKKIILEAKRDGILPDGAPIIESSSGTMALGVALVGTYLGHPVHIVTDPRIDLITLRKLESLGCQIHVVEKMTGRGWQSARLERLHDLLEQYPGAFWPRQYENPNNPLAYAALAKELLDDIGRVDILVASVGSGGSLCGTAQELLKYNPELRVVAVDSVGSVIFGQPDNPKRLQSGLGNSLVAPNVNHELVDEVHWLSDEQAFTATLELAKHEKVFAGNSSGSVYAVARWLSSQVSPETNIVGIFPDRGDRYFQTIYDEQYRRDKDINSSVPLSQPAKVSYQSVVTSWSYAAVKRGNRREKAPALR
ncbi:cysteine synthase family protein [Brevibacillus borstelensis]|jgi:S-sulfo-L-cysteine synthase (3-phospho-L-serine-dependent)|uniref:Pyridoxal-phosphate dependent enzyme n=1 Tax=Brevibacillus borstelensis AK1 TaxID=1300222 RepID=M8DDJ7_9BACL|nr:cysteine synthase family protein [Brevibacillus borstelensis]EMT51518.1 pyridoxal-phosphate dependent enzyme [Brevibacillus borstelensis AK1]KKX56517.1 pyridoxal-5'-phosphate-dependent protein [Brevibacillus borstelensis cifa_chp40]MED1883488.1 cysteine synthase family protein [Brevibacillus borstelensis]RNB61928.1 cysteine synthase family protein [Brevibacillus borstelensis]GED51410.1 putative pyridoxal phosphate-dependent protein CysK2 [Brevibacillus borstelensis]